MPGKFNKVKFNFIISIFTIAAFSCSSPSFTNNENNSENENNSSYEILKDHLTNVFLAPEEVCVNAAPYKNNVILSWKDNGAPFYWIYKNTENDFSSADCILNSATSGENLNEISLDESGTYYFWVKATGGISEDSITSNFSDSVSFDFHYSELTAPKNVVASVSKTGNAVSLKWDDTDASRYWIYVNRVNDCESAVCIARHETSGSICQDITLYGEGEYYFWVKAADDYREDARTSDFSVPVRFVYKNKNI